MKRMGRINIKIMDGIFCPASTSPFALCSPVLLIAAVAGREKSSVLSLWPISCWCCSGCGRIFIMRCIMAPRTRMMTRRCDDGNDDYDTIWMESKWPNCKMVGGERCCCWLVNHRVEVLAIGTQTTWVVAVRIRKKYIGRYKILAWQIASNLS